MNRNRTESAAAKIYSDVLAQKSAEYNAFKTTFFNDGFHGNEVKA